MSQLQGDPLADQEVLEGLDQVYYSEESDPSLHSLVLLGDRLGDLGTIDSSRKERLNELTTVSRRVFGLILEKQGDCSAQLEDMVEVQAALLDGLATCRAGRQGLARAQEQFVSCSLGILAGWRRRQQALQLISHLETIRTLSLTQARLQELLHEEDFGQAISVLLEAIKVSSTFGQFAAIQQLSSRLADRLVMAEEQLDLALARQCTNFQPETYSRLQQAYHLLGKTQTSTDQVLMHFTTAIHNQSWAVVYGHVCLVTPCPRPPPYPELCREVVVDSFLPALTDLLKALWSVLLSYHRLVEWHRAHHWAEGEQGEVVVAYCRNKLEAGVARVWQDVQSKVKQFVLASDLSQFSIDSFLHFLDLLHRLILVGQEFSGSSSSALLHESLVTQCRAYFSSYHATRLDELKVHLENEAWGVCPVKQGFNYRLLQEFAHLNTMKSPTKAAGHTTWVRRFEGGDRDGTPFDELCQESLEEDILAGGEGERGSDSEEELSAAQLRELMEENRDSGRPVTGLRAPAPRPVTRATGLAVANTAVMLLRLVGRYTHMMKVLRPIADTVWLGICQLFEYYLFSCHHLFTADLPDTERAVYSPRLAATLAAVQETIIQREVVVEGQRTVVGEVAPPTLCPGVTLAGAAQLFGLAERLVAVESAVFLGAQLMALQPYLRSSLAADSATMDQFYSGAVAAAADLREPVALAAVASSLDTEAILAMMARVAWDLREVSTQHSPYVDHWLRELEQFAQRVARLAAVVAVPHHLEQLLWRQVVRVAAITFVEGFAAAKRCTNEGRALMQLDFRQFVLQVCLVMIQF